jgi:hypothetical protein
VKIPKVTVIEDHEPSADVHVISSMPNALKVYAQQVIVRRPASLQNVINANRSRIELAKKKDQVALVCLAWGFAVPSVALVATLLFLAWMVSGPIKAAVLAAALFLTWVIF